MQKGVAGQRIGVQMVSASDGSAFTGTVTVYVTGDAGTQAIGSVGSGACTHEGNGYHSYAPAQAETNYDLIAFTFVGSGAVPVTVQVYTAINPVTAVPSAAANATAVRSELGLTGSLDTAFDAIPTAAENGAAGWNRMLVDHTSTGSFGAAIGALSASSGSGARTVTVTVNDGTTALQNAKVRMTSGAETYTALTNVSGVCTFNLNDATYVVSITRNGYSFSGTTLVVDGTETVTYSMSLVVITPSSPSLVTGYWTVLDENGNAAASVVVTIKARQPLRGGVGVIHDAGERTATSNGSGLVQFTNLIPGWRYAVVANDDYVADFVVPADAVTSVELGSIVARLP